MVEQRRPDPVAALGAGVRRGPAVDDDLRAGVLALGDEVEHPVGVLAGDQRAHVGVRRVPVADPQAGGAVGDPGHQVVPDRVDRDHDADRHAPLAGGAVARGDGRVGDRVEVGVGQHQHVVLGAAEGLDPLAGRARLLVDVLRDRRRADEADGRDVGAVQQRVDGDLVALQDVEDAVGQPGLGPEPGHPERRGRVLLAGLEDDGVAAWRWPAGRTTSAPWPGS